MRGLGLAIALVGLCVVAAGVIVVRDRFAPEVDPVSQAALPAVAATPPEAAVPSGPPQSARPVAPDVIAPPQVDSTTLLRLPPREPLSPIGRAHVPSEGPPEARPLHRPVADAAGRFVAQGYEVQLAGIVPTEADETCGDEAWPCGIHARTAFRNLLRGRALTCLVPPAPPDERLVRDCLLGKIDPAAWLVERGWVLAEAGGPYQAQQEVAQKAGLGLFGPAPAITGLPPIDLSPPAPLTSGPGIASGD